MWNRLYLVVVGLCWLAAAALVVVNVRMADDQRDLTRRLEAAERSRTLAVGSAVRPLRGVDRNGKQLTIDSREAEGPVLVLGFTPDCPYVTENWPNWHLLVSSQIERGGSVVMVDFSSEVERDYLEEHEVADLEVLTHLPVQSAVSYHLRATPHTVILEDGIVRGSWTGVLTKSELDRAREILAGSAS